MNGATVALIVRIELRAWRNRLVKDRSSRLAMLAAFLVLGAIVIGGTFFGLADGASQFLPYLREPMLVGAFSALSILMLVVGFPTVIANFFVGTDLMQLVLAPVRPIEIFIGRALLAARANLLLGFVTAMFVLGTGAGAGAPPLFYLIAFAFVVLQVLMVTALQTLLLCLVLQWVPARLARDVSVAVASISGALIYVAWQLTLRQTLGRRPNVSGLVEFARRIDWLPTAWPGHALSSVLDGAVITSLLWLSLTLLLAVVLIGAAAYFYSRTLLTGLGQFAGTSALWRRRAGKPRRVASEGTESPDVAIARKDWITYRRDVRRLSRLLPAVIFMFGYAVFFNRPAGGAIGSFWNNMFLIAFVSMFISMAVATSAVPSERRGFQLLRMAPITMTQLLRAKVLFSMLPIVGLVAAISVGVAILGRNNPADVLQLTVMALWLGFGFVAIGVSVGAIDPRFDALDDRRMVGPLGTLVGVGAELGFGALTLLAFTVVHVAIQVYAGHPVFGDVTIPVGVGIALVAGALILAAAGVAVVFVLLRIAASKLEGFEASIAST
ncbi:MAG TPA: hypothetical protein VNA65_08710 [Candidatus Dormibacteraeota bacterium]|nr:hypothetical protein [Candidatus Dormibacteraeota bacterium]